MLLIGRDQGRFDGLDQRIHFDAALFFQILQRFDEFSVHIS